VSVLGGVRIAVTRAAAQAEELAGPLRAAGADVVMTPLIRIVPTGDSSEMRESLDALPRYDWIIFTSTNGVDLFAEAAHRAGRDITNTRAAIACVGPATAAAAKKHGMKPSVIPDEFVGHAIADALAARGDLAGQRILLARAGRAREELPERLREAGASVSEVQLYYSAMDEDGARALRARIEAQEVDLLTFTSGSTVRYFKEAVGTTGRAKVAVIGPLTADAATRSGMTVDIEANPHTTEGLVAAITRYFRGEAK
jgi:uroporphyrinogen-III synthase